MGPFVGARLMVEVHRTLYRPAHKSTVGPVPNKSPKTKSGQTLPLMSAS